MVDRLFGKAEQVRRIDQQISGDMAASPSTAVYPSRGGNADTIDGLHASTTPRPNALIATDAHGLLPQEIIPTSALSSNHATGHHGMQYVGATTYLVEPLRAVSGDDYIMVLAPVFDNLDSAYLTHYSVDSEKIWIVGDVEVVGRYYRYPIERAKGGTSAQAFPAGSEVISIGGPDDGGYILMNSAADPNAPYIQVRQNNADRSTTWKGQFGRLNDVPSWFQAYFPDIENWNRFGLATYDGFFAGHIYAQGGNISGALDVGGRLTVKAVGHNAKMEFGDTAAGWGMAMRNAYGRPTWMLVTPYADEDGNISDFAWIVESRGERAIYYRQSIDDGEWVLNLGGFEVRERTLEYDWFKIKPWEGLIDLGPGVSIDELNTTIDSESVSVLRVSGDGLYVQGGKSYLSEIDTTNAPNFRYTHGTSTKDPTTDAPDTWLEFKQSGTTYYVPGYAPS